MLTHEEIIDLLWKQQIQPLLLARFPNATPDDLVKAHAYAYGGSVVQDIGYYPFGNHVFSDLDPLCPHRRLRAGTCSMMRRT